MNFNILRPMQLDQLDDSLSENSRPIQKSEISFA